VLVYKFCLLRTHRTGKKRVKFDALNSF